MGEKIHDKDHVLALQGLPSDENSDPDGQIFLITRIMDSFSCSPLFFIYLFIYFKIRFQKSLNMLRCNFTR